MSRLTRLIAIGLAALAVVVLASACGTEHIGPPKSDPHYTSDEAAAQIFNQRCGGCHTLSYAGTQGSGQNPRTYLNISGPNFDQRCERPVERVLYAIENGGFSGAYMPQNIVTGQEARDVAMFVSRYAGRAAPLEPGDVACSKKKIGTLPPLGTPATAASASVKSSSSSGS